MGDGGDCDSDGNDDGGGGTTTTPQALKAEESACVSRSHDIIIADCSVEV